MINLLMRFCHSSGKIFELNFKKQVSKINSLTCFFYSMIEPEAINAGQDANDDLTVNRPTYEDYQNDKDKVEDILNNGISSDKTEIAIGNNGVMERRGYFMRQIQGGSGALKILEDKILFSEDGTFADYKTAISSKGVWAETVFGILIAGETLKIKNFGNNFMVDENGMTMENQAGNFAITADGVRINNLDLMLQRGNTRITMQSLFNPNDNTTLPMLIEKLDGNVWKPVFQIDQNGNVILNDLTANNGTFQGNIVGVTDINTTGTVSVGQDIHLRQLNDKWFDTGGIYFDSQTDKGIASSGRISVIDQISPKLMICTPNGGGMEITTGTNTNNANGDLTLRGYNVFIGSKDGRGEIYVNNDIVVGRDWIRNNVFSYYDPILSSLENRISALEEAVRELQAQQ